MRQSRANKGRFVAPVYDRATKNRDTLDPKDAKALLHELVS
jgi:hypothetical protein